MVTMALQRLIRALFKCITTKANATEKIEKHMMKKAWKKCRCIGTGSTSMDTLVVTDIR